MEKIGIIACMILVLSYSFAIDRLELKEDKFLAKIFMNLWLMLQIIIMVWGEYVR